ncbi:MAG: sodium-dependent bicarbonate transport family permease [Anaerolineae bacterium]|nr:sodium-dependent bicarbonate transport family permease [Anaerolineae bacterium]
MNMLEILALNIFSPVVLAFLLGIFMILVKSDMKIPEQVYSIISIYLLFAMGLKDGFDLARSPAPGIGPAALVALFFGIGVPLWAYWILKRFGKLNDSNAISIAIHYGTVSAVTLSATIAFLNEANESFERFMPTLYILMEIPAIAVGLMLAGWKLSNKTQTFPHILREALTGKGFLLLGGGVVVGYIASEPGYRQVEPFFVGLFPGMLTLFMLEMGTQVGHGLPNLRKMGPTLIVFSVLLPLLHGFLGVALSTLIGLSPGGAMIMGAMAASASYITAPPIVEANVPGADVSFALTASLVLTFPFNLTIGLPIYYELARLMAGLA